MTARVLKHELCTPINHIIGYSELLLEDLPDDTGADSRHAIEALHTLGNSLLALINAELGRASGPDDVVSADVLGTIRAAVRRGVDSVSEERLVASRIAHPKAAVDVARILGAVARLTEFARTGRISNGEADHRSPGSAEIVILASGPATPAREHDA